MKNVTVPDQGKSNKVDLNPNNTNEIRVQSPKQFYFETKSGTKVTGTITPEFPLQITPKDDIKEIILIHISDTQK